MSENNENKITLMEGGITNNPLAFTVKNQNVTFTSLDLTKRENAVKLYNAIEECDILLNDIKGQVIEVNNLYFERKEVADRDDSGEIIYNEDGSVKTKTHYRTIFFGTDGKTYVTSAFGVYSSLQRIIPIFGYPTEENILKLEVTERPYKNTNKKVLSLKVVA